jgi:tetratricopeptide (TPR) repeat protein
MKDPTGFEDAVELAEQYPEDPRVLHTLAYAHETRKEYAAAITAITRAIGISPREPALLFERGGYALKVGDHECAVADFSQGLVLCDEHKSDYYREAFHFLRAEAFVQLGRTAEALADLSHVADDYVFWTTKLRSKEDLLVLCGEEVPARSGRERRPDPEEPVLPESPDEEEAALANELGAAGLAAIDAALLKHARARYLKAARVIADAMDACDVPLDDNHFWLFARRLIVLADAGALEARGNLHNPRRSEVRLPERP